MLMSKKCTVSVTCFDKAAHSMGVVPLHVTLTVKYELLETALQGLFF